MEIQHVLKNYIALELKTRGLTQGAAAKLFGIPAARCSVLCNGKPGKFSISALREFLRVLNLPEAGIINSVGELPEETVKQALLWAPPKRIVKTPPTRARLLELFNDEVTTVSWRTSRKRVKAGTLIKTVDGSGYLAVTADGVMVGVHRVLWVMRNGPIPAGGQIDHRDGNRLNNSPENLRLTSCLGNARNRRKGVNNSSGVKGVTWNKKIGKWQAGLQLPSGAKYLGVFSSLKSAEEVVRGFRISQHGEFTNHGELE